MKFQMEGICSFRALAGLGSLAIGLALVAGCGGGGGGGGSNNTNSATGRIAYTYGDTAAGTTLFVQEAATGVITQQNTLTNVSSPSFNRGGTRVAFLRRAPGESRDVYVQSVNNPGSLNRLTTTPEEETYAAHSPNTDQVYFVRANAGGSTIHRINGDGAGLITVANPGGRVEGLSVSGNGARIAYWFTPAIGNSRLIVRDLGTGAESVAFTASTTGTGLYSNWYDSDRIVASDLDGGAGGSIFLVNRNGSGFSRITTGFDPKTSESGRRYLFGRNVGGQVRLYTAEVDGSNLSVYTLAGTSTGWDWSRS